MICPICNWTSGVTEDQIADNFTFKTHCPRCGDFIVSGEFKAFGADNKSKIDKRHLVSGLLREMTELKLKPPTILTTADFKELSENIQVPEDDDIESKAEKILMFIRRESKDYGSSVTLKWGQDISIGYASDQRSFTALLGLLLDKKLVSIIEDDNGVIHQIESLFQIQTSISKTLRIFDPFRNFKITLTAQGWMRTNSFLDTNQESDRVFIAAWFDQEGTREPFAKAIKEALEECGLKGIYLLREFFGDKIMDKALAEIRQSRFVIVDLTGSRAAVSFEAGFAHALKVETIYVCHKSLEHADFYSRHYQCHIYETEDDLKDTIKNAILARMSKKRFNH